MNGIIKEVSLFALKIHKFGFWLHFSNYFLKVDTFYWILSQKIACRWKLHWYKTSSHSNSFSLCQATLIFLFGDGSITHRMNSFNPTVIKEPIPLYNSKFSSKQIISPPKYSLRFCKYISSNKRQISSDILPSFSKASEHLIGPIFPLLTLLNRDKGGKGKPSNIIIFVWLYSCISKQ